MAEKPRITVPMPTSDEVYKSPEKSYIRDRLVHQYGEASVLRAEVAVCMNVLIATGRITPREFVDLVKKSLARTEEARIKAAGL